MFGTVARLKVKPGEEQAVRQWSERWWRERAPKVKGAVTGYLCKPVNGPPDEYVMLAVFDSKDNYYANANDPEQDRWYQEFRGHLQADPEWSDVEIEQSSKGA
jgi:antibiotic biosynthesis monooxygenase (ABM) superfamily enzyme